MNKITVEESPRQRKVLRPGDIVAIEDNYYIVFAVAVKDSVNVYVWGLISLRSGQPWTHCVYHIGVSIDIYQLDEEIDEFDWYVLNTDTKITISVGDNTHGNIL